MAQAYSKLLFHIVFSTKNRMKDLTAAVRSEFYPYLETVLRNKGGRSLAVGGGLDHVHLLVELPPALAVSSCVSALKANSSRWLRERFNLRFAWQPGYAVFSVSLSQADRVRSYIEGQRAHHQRVAYEDELMSLLLRNEIEFEASKLWG